MLTRRHFLATATAALSVSALPALAGGLPVGPFFAKSGVAIRGADPVANFTDGKAVYGERSITYDWKGATWRFASAKNRDAFIANPEAYAPQYGGNFSWAVANGYKASTVPEAWKIVDGKLYLNYSKSVQRRWEKDVPNHIASGNANWPSLSRS